MALAYAPPIDSALPIAVELPGLRERSKAKRRVVIQRAALTLFAERGYDATTIADVAQLAEVARRTVTGYFPSKLDLAVSVADEIAARLVTALQSGPADDLLIVIDKWLRGEATSLNTELARLSQRAYATNPQLAAISSAHVAMAAEVGVVAAAAQLGRSVGDPMVTVFCAALGAALRSYLDVMASGGASADLHASLMAFLRLMFDAARAVD